MFNRDMLLMVKDTMTARYASKLSLVLRADGQDGPQALDKLTEFYCQGDLMMKINGQRRV